MNRPFHPFAFAAFPILFLLAHNRDVTNGSEAIRPLLIAGAVVLVALPAARLVLGSLRKAGVAVSALALLFLSYGHVWTALAGARLGPLPVGRDLVLGPIWITVGAVTLVALARTRRTLEDLTRVLNIVAGVLVLTAVVPLVGYRVGSAGVREVSTGTQLRPTEERPRDIYYLMFDRYADAETLREHFGFDNSAFISSLEERGFAVAHDARANYQNTHMSLASSMNMDHLHWLGEGVGDGAKDRQPILDAIDRSEVARLLKDAGYRYIHVGSWTHFTAKSSMADVNLEPTQTSEFTRALYASTALSVLSRHVTRAAPPDDNTTQRDTTLGQWRAIERASGLRGPKFVFAHVIPPHPPYVFDRHGNYSRETKREGNVEGYLEQVRYVNAQIERILDRLLAGPPEERPIVIIQSDEGPYPRLSVRFPDSWSDEPPGDIRVKFGILSAYLLPGHAGAVYPSMSPVNTFRVIFNRYFGTDLPLLPDESYAVKSTSSDIYTLVPLGDRVRGSPPPPPPAR